MKSILIFLMILGSSILATASSPLDTIKKSRHFELENQTSQRFFSKNKQIHEMLSRYEALIAEGERTLSVCSNTMNDSICYRFVKVIKALSEGMGYELWDTINLEMTVCKDIFLEKEALLSEKSNMLYGLNYRKSLELEDRRKTLGKEGEKMLMRRESLGYQY